MESFEMFGLPRTIRAGLKLLFKNSFLHEVPDVDLLQLSSSVRSHSAPPRLAGTFEQKNGTTLMVRNIPTKFNQVSFLEAVGYQFNLTSIDFFYLPLDFKSGKSLGYCFINFASSTDASNFKNMFDRKRMNPNSSKLLEITIAKVQGFAKNYNLFSTSSIMTIASPEFRPMIKCKNCDVLRPLASGFDACGSEVLCPICS